jgi:hypothetical protein
MDVCAVCGQTRRGSANFCAQCGTSFVPPAPRAPASLAPIAEAPAPSSAPTARPLAPIAEAPAPAVSARPLVIHRVPVSHREPPPETGRSGTKPLIMPADPDSDPDSAPDPAVGPDPDPDALRSRRGGDMILTVIVAAIVLFAGAGTASWLLTHHSAKQVVLPAVHVKTVSPPGTGSPGTKASRNHSRAAGSSGISQPAAGSSGTGVAGAGSGTAPPGQTTPSLGPASESTPPASGQTGLVIVGHSAAADPRAPAVLAFARNYFSAINKHSFWRYVKLLSASLRQGLTKASFEQDFGSSADSAATIVRIFTVGSGMVGVSISFTSRQKPSQSPTGTESCTKWVITLYLDDHSGHYQIGQAPPSYSPIDYAC